MSKHSVSFESGLNVLLH